MRNFEIFKRNVYSNKTINDKEFLINRNPYLDIVVTDRCNRKCKFCIADLIDKKEDIDVDIFKRQIEYAIQNFNIEEVLVVGGEPTISKHITTILQYLHQLRLEGKLKKICMTTNGDALSSDRIRKLLIPYITHLNISVMCVSEDSQKEIGNTKESLSKIDISNIFSECQINNVMLRLNANVFRNNLDTLDKVLIYYNEYKSICNSIKFSPLLKVDDYSVVNKVLQFVKENILDELEYDALYKEIEQYYVEEPIVRNPSTFGFVEYSMICLDTPIILNYNHRGKMALQASKNYINNIKLLSNGNLSLSWNKEDTSKVISFGVEVTEWKPKKKKRLQ